MYLNYKPIGSKHIKLFYNEMSKTCPYLREEKTKNNSRKPSWLKIGPITKFPLNLYLEIHSEERE